MQAAYGATWQEESPDQDVWEDDANIGSSVSSIFDSALNDQSRGVLIAYAITSIVAREARLRRFEQINNRPVDWLIDPSKAAAAAIYTYAQVVTNYRAELDIDRYQWYNCDAYSCYQSSLRSSSLLPPFHDLFVDS